MAVERGVRRTFAVAIDQPGWARSGADGAAALESLLASAPRFKRAAARAQIRFAARR